MKLFPLLTLSIILAFFTSCANFNPALVRPGTSLAVSNSLQFGFGAEVRTKAANEYLAIATALDPFLTGAAVPSVEVFRAQLDLYLPKNETKSIVLANATALYASVYPSIADEPVSIYQEVIRNIILGARDGATPFASLETFR